MAILIDIGIPSPMKSISSKNRRGKSKYHHKIVLMKIRERRSQKQIIRKKRKAVKKIKRMKRFFEGERFTNSFIKFIKTSKFTNNSEPAKKLKKDNDGHVIINIPQTFSLFHNPDKVIETYHIIFKYGSMSSIPGLNFNHTLCTDLELGASAVMDVFVIHLLEYKKRLLKKSFAISGTLPSKGQISEVLFVSGLLKHLKIDKSIPKIIHEHKQNLKTLELIRGGQHATTMLVTKAMNSQTAATKIIKYIAECVRTQDCELSKEGHRYFSHLICEVLDNCQIHSGDFCQWFALGHFDIVEGNTYGQCNLVLFNFGNTIYESLKNGQLSPEIESQLYNLSKQFTNKRKSDWNEEELWTLYALQEGISRLKNTDENQRDRGVGTVKLINAFQEIGRAKDGNTPTMSIISGNTYILFNNKYFLEDKVIDGTTVKTIAFNETNDINLPPDPENVKRLENYFPGTIITMKFYLDSNFIKPDTEEI